MTPRLQLYLAENGAKLVLLVVLVLIGALLWWKVGDWREEAKTGAERIEQRDQRSEAAEGISEDLGAAMDDRGVVENIVHGGTRTAEAQLERQRNEDPDLAARLASPWPVELRELARARREARDRLSGDAGRRAGADPGTAAPGEGDAR